MDSEREYGCCRWYVCNVDRVYVNVDRVVCNVDEAGEERMLLVEIMLLKPVDYGCLLLGMLAEIVLDARGYPPFIIFFHRSSVLTLINV